MATRKTRARVTYVIDRQDVIRSTFRHDIAISRQEDDVIEALEKIQQPVA